MEGNFKKWINRINSKQDVLTEDNVGQFMDLELTTKSTPASGDTVLGRDSLTGKAVEIPTSSLGGGGSVDTSNLVPYTGANKDVNIASNYFKTSKGFDFTKDAYNYFRVHKFGDYNYLEFSSLDTSTNNFGNTIFRIDPEEDFYFSKQTKYDSNSFNITTYSTFSNKKFVTDEGYEITGGTSSQYLMADGSVSTLTNPITGTGTTNYIPKFSASGILANSVIYDDNSDVGIGTTNINLKQTGRRVLDINGSTQSLLSFSGNGVNLGYIWAKSDNFLMSSSTIITFTVGSERMRITNAGNIGISTASPTEKLDVNGYAKATGFKTPTGTAIQALTADGGVFDLNTKADLVSGKIPATQLPSYVDDVLEFANLASFPATGESGKIYIAIDTNLTYRFGGSSYVVMSSSLALGETSSTAYRGDLGDIAYDHSQKTTGNPHNTKVEELSDVSGTDTTIEDTDIILKKEVVGGLWRKITWANIKSALKTYFDSLYAPKSFNVKVTTPSSWVTGTTSEVEVLIIEIPANSLSYSDVLIMPFLMINKVGTAGTIFIKGKLSTSQTMPSGTTDQIFQTAVVAATNQFVGLDRSFIIDDGKLKGFPIGIPSYTSSAISSNLILQKPFDRTVTNYLYISIQLGNTADKARLEGMQLTNS